MPYEPVEVRNCEETLLRIDLYKGVWQNGVWLPGHGPTVFGYVKRPDEPRSAQGFRKIECWAFASALGESPQHGPPPFELRFSLVSDDHSANWHDAFVDTPTGPSWPPLVTYVTSMQIYWGDYEVRLLDAGVTQPNTWRVSRPQGDPSEYWNADPPSIQAGYSHIFLPGPPLPEAQRQVRITHMA